MQIFKFYLRFGLLVPFLFGFEEPDTVLFTVFVVSETSPRATFTVPDTPCDTVLTAPLVSVSPFFTTALAVRTTGRTRLLAKPGKLNLSLLSDILYLL
jgi:hypothetical protein